MGSELADAAAALSAGRWSQARDTFAAALAVEESAAAQHGLGQALWWLGDTDQAVQHITDAYAGFRRCRDLAGAVQCAVWLAIVHQANFGNAAVANGWARRAERLLAGEPPGVLHGWALVARAYRNPDTPQAEALTTRALDLAREADNVDLELVALAQLGRILVGRGDPAVGFALLDEAVAASLGGERSSLDTVAYTCCDMLSACEQVSDLDRARQWSAAADAFVERFGCPFLYAECRIAYGSVLVDRGRWTEAERELAAGLHTSGTSAPALRVRAQARLAELRIRQGEWESAAELLGEPSEQPELTLARASLALARAEPGTARNLIEHQRPAIADPRLLAASLGLLVEACLAVGLVAEATAHVEQLCSLAADREHVLITAQAAMAEGRLCLAVGSRPDAHQRLVAAESAWRELDLPYELAGCRFELARSVSTERPEEAVRYARAAHGAFTTLGAASAADRTAELLRGLGVATPGGPKGHGGLTVREQEVLTLLGRGLSNPEIAARLRVSRKTAAHHVSRVLTKLDLRNRASAAAFAARSAP